MEHVYNCMYASPAGTGASHEGNRPFLDVLDVDSGETERLWQSSPPFFEYTGSLLCDLHDKPIRQVSQRLVPLHSTERNFGRLGCSAVFHSFYVDFCSQMEDSSVEIVVSKALTSLCASDNTV